MEISNRSRKIDNNVLFEELKANNEIEHPFFIDGVKYKWMSIADMEKDPSIKKHNMDVVRFVKNNY